MTSLNQQQNIYLETQIKTATPLQLVCMLYDGAIKFANLALAGIREKNIEKKTVNIIKTEKIVNELRNSLNFEKGGEIAVNLDKLYDFMFTYLIEANSNDDEKKLMHVIKMLEMLRESWYAIANKPINIPQQSSINTSQQNKLNIQKSSQTVINNNKGPEERLDLAC